MHGNTLWEFPEVIQKAILGGDLPTLLKTRSRVSETLRNMHEIQRSSSYFPENEKRNLERTCDELSRVEKAIALVTKHQLH